MNLPYEPPGIIDSSKPPVSWPSEGRIQLENLKIRYHPNAPLVLKGINCMFKGGKRMGVVGRTGSGKNNSYFCLISTHRTSWRKNSDRLSRHLQYRSQ